MSHEKRFAEDLPSLAAEAYQLADQHCGLCRDFHALWPYRRLTRMVEGPESGRTELEAVLRALFAAGRKAVLIAGAADTGVLALTAQAADDKQVEFTVIDLCSTPLELCRKFAKRWSLSLKTIQQDLRSLDVENQFDVVIAHALLQFIPAESRVDFLSRIARALRPDGRLMLVFNASRRITGDLVPEYRSGYARWLLDELNRLKIPVPEPRETFRLRLDSYARNRERREGTFATADDVSALLAAAGFAVETEAALDTDLAAPYREYNSKLAKRLYLIVAKSKSG